jgi:hypothetical protein
MVGSVVQTGSEPEPDLIGTEPVVWFQVQPTPPNVTSVQFGVLSFQSKNQTELDYSNTIRAVVHLVHLSLHSTSTQWLTYFVILSSAMYYKYVKG